MTRKEFNNEVNSSADVAVQRANKFLEQLDLSLSINWEYDSWEYNDLNDAIGVYENGSVFGGDISIGFNMANLYKSFISQVKEYPWTDKYTILDEIIQTNVFHEMGHGIIDLLNDYLQETDDLDELYDSNQELFDNVLDNEEDSVEEFAWAMYDNDLEKSGLYRLVTLYLNLYSENNMVENVNNRKIYINSKQYGMLKESEWNLHYGGYDNGYGHGGHNMKPHMSDNKHVMVGRDTGHFGSGTYFSTYSFSDTQSKPLRDSMNNQDPNFIQIGDNVYRVDLDLYKNLYRVRSKKQGDILYTMMKNLNMMYNKICQYMGNFKDGSHANYNNAINYQIISRNAEALNLKCPSYYKLTRMAQEHGKDKDAIQSFSTLFMELNGYNGVNVSGVEYYDNTLHGSVIYDLSKVNTDMEEVSPKSLFTGLRDRSYDNTIANKGYDDEIADSLNGEYINWYYKINNMPLSHAMRVLKNYTDSGHLLNAFTVRKFDEDLQKRYLRLIFAKDPTDMFGKSLCTELLSGDNSRWYLELIENTKSYYWVNYYDERYKVSGLVRLLCNYSPSWGLSSEEQMADKERYLEMLEGYMQRDLTPMEEEYIKEDFLYDWDGFYSSSNTK